MKYVEVYAESTPNPSTMKFVADVRLTDEPVEYTSAEQTKGSSSFAEALFNFPFVTGLFFANNFVTITKNDALQWEYVSNELRAFIADWLMKHDVVIEKMPERQDDEASCDTAQIQSHPTIQPEINTDADRMIVNLLEEYVRPAVEGDGGAIDFVRFDEITGTVTVLLRGSCSGCPSSTATLKGGIESLLKTHMPEVQSVEALEG